MQIIKVPGINGLGKTKGCERAGNAILDALKEIYSNEQGKIVDASLLDLEEIHLDNGNMEITNKLIYENSLEAFEMKPRLVFLGGDHSISFSLVRGFLEHTKKQRKEPCLIVFDAHPDCMEPVDGTFPTHEEWLRGVVEAGFPPENILLVGLRNSDPKEIRFMEKNKIKRISINEFVRDIDNACDTVMEFANGRELYLSLDIDVVDPAFAPATGYIEPGGLTSRQLIYILQRMNKMKNLRGVDIVEINEKKDREYGGVTVKLGAKILAEII
ncbi:MAG: arginase family protein [Nanoarchaeota archaeon]|nr:arginase family protein [Nanoarchaeota archaeon]